MTQRAGSVSGTRPGSQLPAEGAGLEGGEELVLCGEGTLREGAPGVDALDAGGEFALSFHGWQDHR